MNNVIAPFYHRHFQVGKPPNVPNAASLGNRLCQGKRAVVWISPQSLRTCHKQHSTVTYLQQGATQRVTVVFALNPHTCRKYGPSFHQTFEGPYFRKRTSARHGPLEMNWTALLIQSVCSTEAQSEVKHIMHRHNHRRTFNNILVQTVTSRAHPRRRSCYTERSGSVSGPAYTRPTCRH